MEAYYIGEAKESNHYAPLQSQFSEFFFFFWLHPQLMEVPGPIQDAAAAILDPLTHCIGLGVAPPQEDLSLCSLIPNSLHQGRNAITFFFGHTQSIYKSQSHSGDSAKSLTIRPPGNSSFHF